MRQPHIRIHYRGYLAKVIPTKVSTMISASEDSLFFHLTRTHLCPIPSALNLHPFPMPLKNLFQSPNNFYVSKSLHPRPSFFNASTPLLILAASTDQSICSLLERSSVTIITRWQGVMWHSRTHIIFLFRPGWKNIRRF